MPLAKPQDAEGYVAHLARHIAESGKGSNPIFAPFESGRPWETEGKAHQIQARWSTVLSVVGWERSWVIRDIGPDRGKIVAHLDIGCDRKTLPSSLHRAWLSMGIEEEHRRRGLGTALMQDALEWARAQPSLEWLELEVFRQNEAAFRFYQKAGFTEVGTTIDKFRVAGKSIDDAHLVLKLRK